MYDPRNSLTNEVSAQLHSHFGDKVYRTVVPRNVRLAEAPSHGVPAMHYDRYSRGSKAYMALAGEIIRRRNWRLREVATSYPRRGRSPAVSNRVGWGVT